MLCGRNTTYPVSQTTSGRLTASQSKVILDGVCDHAPSRVATALGARVRVGDAGGETAFVGVAWFAVDVRVARFRGEESVDCAVAVSGSGNSLGCPLVATILATEVMLFIMRFKRRSPRYCECDAEVRSVYAGLGAWKWALLELDSASELPLPPSHLVASIDTLT